MYIIIAHNKPLEKWVIHLRSGVYGSGCRLHRGFVGVNHGSIRTWDSEKEAVYGFIDELKTFTLENYYCFLQNWSIDENYRKTGCNFNFMIQITMFRYANNERLMSTFYTFYVTRAGIDPTIGEEVGLCT